VILNACSERFNLLADVLLSVASEFSDNIA
jgi:hypothetical protein